MVPKWPLQVCPFMPCLSGARNCLAQQPPVQSLGEGPAECRREGNRGEQAGKFCVLFVIFKSISISLSVGLRAFVHVCTGVWGVCVRE